MYAAPRTWRRLPSHEHPRAHSCQATDDRHPSGTGITWDRRLPVRWRTTTGTTSRRAAAEGVPAVPTGVRAVCSAAARDAAVIRYRRTVSQSPSCLQFEGMGCAARPAGAFVLSTGLTTTSVTGVLGGFGTDTSVLGWGCFVCPVLFSHGGQASAALTAASWPLSLAFSSLSVLRSSLDG
jgi:hypothetical protein